MIEVKIVINFAKIIAFMIVIMSFIATMIFKDATPIAVGFPAAAGIVVNKDYQNRRITSPINNRRSTPTVQTLYKQ